MNKLNDLTEAMEALFMAGADDAHDGSEMLELLEDVDFPAVLNILTDKAKTLYAYTVTAGQPYCSKPLVKEKASFLFEDVKSEGVKDGVLYNYSLELWLLEDMTFLVTACFCTVVPGKLVNSFRTVKGMFPNACGMDIDYVELANALTLLPSRYYKNRVPIYEQ